MQMNECQAWTKESLHYRKHISSVAAKFLQITGGAAKATGHIKDFVGSTCLQRDYIISLVISLITMCLAGSWIGPVTADTRMGITLWLAAVCAHNQSR